MRDFSFNSTIIDIVALKFEYLNKVSDKDLFLELIPLYEFIMETTPVFEVVQKNIIELQNGYEEFAKVESEVAEKLKVLKDKFIILRPTSDDSNYDDSQMVNDPRSIDMKYIGTFKRFDNLLVGKNIGLDNGTPVLPPNEYDNSSPVKNAMSILMGKFQKSIEGLDKVIPEDIKQFYFELYGVTSRYDYLYKKFVNFRRISLGSALIELEHIVEEINPRPKMFTKFEDMLTCPQPYALRPLAYEPIRKIVYKGENPDPELIIEVKNLLNRINYGLVTGISQNLLHDQVVSKFKTRCMWYDKVRVRKILLDSQGNLIRNKEDELIKEMARYLFDNGFPVLFHVQTENLQTDLMDPSVKYPLLIEGKAYTSSCKSELIQGIAQLHDYLNNFETTHYYIRDAYYVVFRINGPIYDFPKEIITNRYRIIPVIIDLGDSTVSGRNQVSQPVIINNEEIIHEIDSCSSDK